MITIVNSRPSARRRQRIGGYRALLAGGLVGVAIALAACGGKSDEVDPATKAAALSLQQAMGSTSRAIDGLRSTRASLDRVGASLQSSAAQTGDVIAVLTTRSAESEFDSELLAAARQQRTFLQLAQSSTESHSASVALGEVARANDAGRRASEGYATLAQKATALGGLLPESTTFNIGRLRDAVRVVNTKKKTSTETKGTTGGTSGGTTGGTTGGATAGADCGSGISVNSNTTCPFARNVADAYAASGGSSVIDVYSPVTKTSYTMTCTGGAPVVCSGGNGAVVYIR